MTDQPAPPQTDAAPPRRPRILQRLRRIGGVRLAITIAFLAVALLIARFSWDIPLAGQAERALYDLRATSTAPKAEPDPRIVMVVYDDDTLIETRKRSPLDRAMLARALGNIDTMGAKAIGIDILIDQPQDEDPQLIDSFRAMGTPTWLAYASASSNAEDIQFNQQKFLEDFQAQLKGSQTAPTSIRLEVDGDNVVRSWPQSLPGLPPLLSVAMTGDQSFADHRGSIRFRIPAEAERKVFDSFPIQLFADDATAAAFAEQIRGKYVLIGGAIIDVDEFETPLRPLTGSAMWGLEVHAHMLAQLLDGAKLSALPGWVNWGLAALAVLAGALSSMMLGAWWRMAILLAAQLALFGGLPFWMQRSGIDTQFVPAFGWAVGWMIAFAAVGAAARAVGSEQRRFAQSALGKYLPRDIANQIMADPDRLALHGEKRAIFVVFSDLEGFTRLSHEIPPEMVARLLNTYLDMLSDVVLEHGGTIDKFVGDAVVAFWGAPISRPDDGERAARAAYAMWQAGEAFRRNAPEGVPPIGKTRVGLHFGDAIVGNFGGEGRIQYTALGDSMNTAARIEAASKPLKTSVLASREAVERSGLDWWRPMGRVQLRGRATAVDLFEPVPELAASDRHHFAQIINRIDDGDRAAIRDLEQLSEAHEDDGALANLVHRYKTVEAGGVYVLD
ncbi:adenylate/guanylate cyclase domain-containing protein [Sphingomonas sp. C3-2]|uniref:adenylate/guanylate cyclase domain-containing protein n=1 Tax=Sphingomonas sp. C3-2 TaxID=3062169 RepID=UPI00294B2DFF|nr:adenylate/guanylate cyclase domain-containing protein [Sphingomonas sp. C3-2]WOK36559.1 adenylate/guanylate cyclase domain-containing protein [Sphingomonas sp. C3-2]